MTAVPDTLEDAALALADGRPCIFPTDTVYGVGVAVRAASGPDVLFDVKQRDAGSLSLGLLGRLKICNGMGRTFRQLFVSLLSAFGRALLPLSLKLRI